MVGKRVAGLLRRLQTKEEEITRDRIVQLFTPKLDLDNAYRQMKFSGKKMRQCVFAITRAKYSGYYIFKVGFTDLSKYHKTQSIF